MSRNTETNPVSRQQLPRRDILIALGFGAGAAALGPRAIKLIDALLPETPGSHLNRLRKIDDPSIKAVEMILSTSRNKNRDIGPANDLIVAKKYGLTVFNEENFDELEINENNGFQVDSFEHSHDIAAQIMAKYGVDLVLGDESYSYEYSGRPLSEEDRNAWSTSTVNRLAKFFFSYPMELIKESGLKKIVLATFDNSIDAYVPPDEHPDTIFLDPNHAINPDDLAHDLYHIYDAKISSTFAKTLDDPGYSYLNPDGFKYTGRLDAKGAAPYISLPQYNLLEQTLNPAELEQQRQLVAVAEEQAFANIREDKAGIGMLFLCRHFPNLDDTPILRNKLVFLLARIYRDHPDFVRYYAETSRY